MITPITATKYIYKILNVTSLTDLITGGIYRLDKPKNSELQDIVINDLFLKSGQEEEAQNGQLNVNCYAKKINGQADIITLEKITYEVIRVLNEYKQNVTSFNFTILAMNTINDLQQNSMNYINIKLEIHNL